MQKLKVLLPAIPFLVVALAAFQTVSGDQCADLAKAGNCTFYNICIEDVQKCGQSGYALGYGYKYCRRFNESKYVDNFDDNVSFR